MKVTAQFLRFLAVGALNTVFGYSVFAGLVLVGVASMPALVAAYVVGVPFNYFTTGRLVFAGAPRSASAFLRFTGAYVVVYAFNALMLRAVDAAVGSPLLAQALCIPAVAVFSFLLFKLHVFRDTAPAGQAPR